MAEEFPTPVFRMTRSERRDGAKVLDDEDNIEDYTYGPLGIILPEGFYRALVQRIKSLEQRVTILEGRSP